MNRDDIIYLLKQLNEKLRLREIFGEIYILGGSAICLAYDGDRATKDIDALFHPKTEIYELIYEIADDEQISYDWLNDGVKGFVDDNYEFEKTTCIFCCSRHARRCCCNFRFRSRCRLCKL